MTVVVEQQQQSSWVVKGPRSSKAEETADKPRGAEWKSQLGNLSSGGGAFGVRGRGRKAGGFPKREKPGRIQKLTGPWV